MYHVYVTLEGRLNEFAEKGNVVWKPLHRPHQLARTEALKRDLVYFLGKKVDFEALTPSTATQDYIDRLNHVAETDPLLLLSHAYTRYLGDLSGGRVLQRVAQKALQLPKPKDGEPSGLQFYDFPNIPEGAKTFKDWYRQTLDGLELSELDIAKLVGEANVAFLMNMRVFEELDVKAGVKDAQVRPLTEALKYYDDAVQAFEEGGLDKATNANAPSGECPFLSKKAATSNKLVTGQKCPMNAGTKQSSVAAIGGATYDSSKRCPWPFVFFHDPAQGMRDYQTWVVVCLFSCFIYKVVILPFLV
jgi:heme oxygenase